MQRMPDLVDGAALVLQQMAVFVNGLLLKKERDIGRRFHEVIRCRVGLSLGREHDPVGFDIEILDQPVGACPHAGHILWTDEIIENEIAITLPRCRHALIIAALPGESVCCLCAHA